MKTVLLLSLLYCMPPVTFANHPFVIGCYELPQDDDALRRMVSSGISLVRANSREDLDRIHAAGAKGWVPLAVQQGATDALRAQVEALADHPALAVWEGPDEIVWTFTAYSGLKESAGFTRQDWESQQPKAVQYAEEQAATIIPNMLDGIRLVKELDPQDRPFWMNEARDSDAHYVRQYLPAVDAVGADDYPIRPQKRDLLRLIRGTDRWEKIAAGKPVWMVLQAFSWHEIGSGTDSAWPTFSESRFMAYGVVAHGARGVLYWGSSFLKNEAFRTSLYALTSELSSLKPFLDAPEEKLAEVQYLEALDQPEMDGISVITRRVGDDWLIVLVNEDNFPHLGVEVRGLTALGQRPLHLLYGQESVQADATGAFITRLQPYEVKAFATSRAFETQTHEGRDYQGD